MDLSPSDIQYLLETYEALPEEDKAAIDSMIAEDMKAAPWRPMIDAKNPDVPTPQRKAYDSKADVMLYGGAAGGGKSSLIIGLALTAHRRSTIFRREINQLSPFVDEIIRIRGTRNGFNSQKNIFNLGDGNSIRLGGMQYETDKQAFQGDARDLMAFDEVTQFLESQVRYVITWNRPGAGFEGQRCRVVMATNPPTTAEGDWIISYYAPWLDREHPNPALPGELRWFISDAEGNDQEVDGPEPVLVEGEFLTPRSRTFIPSSVDDNVYLEGSGYKAGLQALPEPLRSQMLRGDFLAGREDDPWQVIPTAWVEAAQDRWTERRPENVKMSTIGFDPTRGGKDKAVLAPRYGWWFDRLIIRPGEEFKSGHDSAAFVAQNVRHGASIQVDVIGAAGASAYDQMASNGMNVEAVDGRKESHGHDIASGRMGFFNTRSENWWRLREALDPETGDDIALPPSRTLKADLCAPMWKLTARGIQVEGKSRENADGFGDIKARLGRSPDEGDAVVLALREGKPAAKKGRRGPARANSRYNTRNFRARRAR